MVPHGPDQDVDKGRHRFTDHEYSSAKKRATNFGVPEIARYAHYITATHCDGVPGDGKPGRIARFTYIIYIDAYYNLVGAGHVTECTERIPDERHTQTMPLVLNGIHVTSSHEPNFFLSHE